MSFRCPQSRFLHKSLRHFTLAICITGIWSLQPQSFGQSLKPDGASPHASFGATWQSLGPSAVVSPVFGKITGRITSIAFDPNDTTGNTVYLGSTGGGIWKSTNASGLLAAVTFSPLTDTLPIFSPNAGSNAIPSLSIGAIAVQPTANPVVLAGTGDPNNAADSFYGEGLLRSTDNGLTWGIVSVSHDGANGNHSFAGLSTAGIAWSTASTSLVVAAFTTSPQAGTVAATNSASVPGLYYSTDAGQTWHMSSLYDGGSVVQEPLPSGTAQGGNPVTSVVWNAKRGRFYAAVRAHGYYSSPDGVTWTRLTTQPGTMLTTAKCPVGLNGTGSSSCPIFRGTLAVQPVTGDLYALTVDATNLDQGLWQDLCSVTSQGSCANVEPAFASRIDNNALETTAGSTAIPLGSYNLSVNAAPTDSNGTLLFAGTNDLFRCTLAYGSNTCIFRNTTNATNGCSTSAGVAPAQHALASFVQSGGGPIILLGNDGGLWRSTDGLAETGTACNATDASHFDNLNGALAAGNSLAEVVGFSQHPTNADTLIAGLGANGSAATTSATGLGAWSQLAAGEGSQPLIDPSEPANWIVSIGAGINLKRCANGAACSASDFSPPATIGAVQVGNDASLLDPPVLLDPAATTNVLIGTCRVWRGPASDGSLWSSANALSPALNNGATPCDSTSPLIRSLAAGGPSTTTIDAAHTGSQVIYAGLAGTLNGGGVLGGHLFVTTSANAADGTSLTRYWTDISLSPVTNATSSGGMFNPNGFDVSSIVVDPHDPTGGTVYAAIKGFGVPHLYRSADFGRHWLNITSNLPNSPANNIIVDPNDANTLYIALDAGVYATQTVTTCATENCWSLLGIGLPNSPVTQLLAAAQLSTDDGHVGLLRAATHGRGLWQMPLLSAISIATPALTVSPTALNFAAQQVSTQSTAQTITLTSSGSSSVTISSVVAAGDFTTTDTCTGQSLAINSTCSMQVSFAPTATGTRQDLLTIYANIAGGQVTVPLTGTATAPAAIVLTPPSLTFDTTTVNQSSAAKIITVANTGSDTATLQTPALSSDFNLKADTCSTTLPAQTACSFSVVFTPTASGTRTGALTLIDSVGTQVAQLTGTGQSPATDALAPASLQFTQQAIGSASTPQSLTLTNAGDVPLTLIAASIGGGDFTVINGCGNSLAAHASCTLAVGFVPINVGNATGTLLLTDQFRTQTVALSGIGIAPPGVSLTPTTLIFPATGVGLSAAANMLTLTNNGGQPLVITGETISPDFSIASTTCDTTLNVGAACTFILVFTPSAAGSRTGTFILSNNAPAGRQTVNLSGTGIDFTFAADGLTAATVKSGDSATYSMLLRSTAGLTGNVAFACTGAPAHSLCTVSPATVSLGNTTVITATVQTGLSSATLTPPQLWRSRSVVVLAFMLPVFCLRRSRRISTALASAFLALVLTSLSACGTGRLIPGSGTTTATSPTPTPPGTYTLTIAATAAGLTHNQTVTLIVQ